MLVIFCIYKIKATVTNLFSEEYEKRKTEEKKRMERR